MVQFIILPFYSVDKNCKSMKYVFIYTGILYSYITSRSRISLLLHTGCQC